ncbi:DNA-directed RNA polymerase subunit beta [Mycoplasma sp. ATU-Cv-508]|uniref:DNA-directed RNA polymerase subunit beta n=1 Tax=Mycoplasma sp. ATU-Cv-508 TaxID=2048001 RepID=UPI000FDD02CE
MPVKTAVSRSYQLRKFGPITERRDYSRNNYHYPVEDLVRIQKDSFHWFLTKGLEETFRNIYPIDSTNGKLTIEYVDGSLRLDKYKDEFQAIKMARQKGTTLNVKVYATLRRKDNETGEVKTQEVLFGEVPMMTQGGNFVVNGSIKVVVSQLIRSPGAYFEMDARKGSDKDLFNKLEIIPKLGMWIRVFHKVTKSKSDIKVSIDKNNVSLSTFLRAFGMTKTAIAELYGTSPELVKMFDKYDKKDRRKDKKENWKEFFDQLPSLFGSTPVLAETLRKDKKETEIDALDYVHGILKKGDRITNESRRNLFVNFLFNKRRYDLLKTGRYLINKKLNLVDRLEGTILAQDLATVSGKVLYKTGTPIDFKLAKEIQSQFDEGVLPTVDIPEISTDVYGKQVDFYPNLLKRNQIIVVQVYPNESWMEQNKNPLKIIANDPNSQEEHLLISDIVAAIGYYFNLLEGVGTEDDPDSLVNKRVVTIGELLQNQFQIALTKLERSAKERMSANEPDKITAKNITNNKIVYNQFKTFFNSSQLSQFMDQVNPLAEIANKRRITSLGPGGLNRETAIIEVRDVHATHYGRICPIESPEGPNIGLILNFATYPRINQYGFIETPYFPVENGKIIRDAIYLSASDEKGKTFAQSSVAVDEDDQIVEANIVVRKDGDYIIVPRKEVNYVDVSSRQMTSISSSCIPFLENDDANRALMGANMQRQAVPLLESEAPLIATGAEADIARYSAYNKIAEEDGQVNYVDSQVIKIKGKKNVRTYYLRTFERSNQGTLISQRPIVQEGQKISKGQVLTDASSFDQGELALGKNVVVAFTTWNGYNYEDAIIISERLVRDDVYTSIHIEEQTIQFRKAKSGDDELSRDLPNVSNFAKRNLDDSGIIRVGSEVQAGDVLVGRISPKSEDNPTPEEKLIAAIFSQRAKNIKDTSLKVKHGHGGTVIDVQVLSRENGDKLQDGISMIVKVFIAQKRKIKVGDKMAGRHGNKGVISRILPVEDMPYLSDGTPVDIMLNPQGVPSRMNIGQVLELHLGMAAKALGVKFVSPVFDGIKYRDVHEALAEANLPLDGKFDLYDPILGAKFAQKVSVGVMYMLKLAHMVDDKMHARSVGPYSLITQQPLGGKSQNGGQRFGEMEAWAVESYGASNVLQELLTYKSDNIDGRNKIYNALTNGMPLPNPGTPESFSVLAYELRGLCLKLGVEVKKEE